MSGTQLRVDPNLPVHEHGSEYGESLSKNDNFQQSVDKPRSLSSH